MVLLHILSFGFFVENFCVHFLYFEFGVVIELFNHVPVHLDVVPLGLYLGYFILVELQVGLQFRPDHLNELIVWLLLLLRLARRHRII